MTYTKIQEYHPVEEELVSIADARKCNSGRFLSPTCSPIDRGEERRMNSTKRSDAIHTPDDTAYENMLSYLKIDHPYVPDTHCTSEVASFFNGRSVFISGASGFVGKCLLEKLLRSCPGIEEIFILMRPKRGLEVPARVEKLVQSELFDHLRNSPLGQTHLKKITAIRGDITKTNFDISEQDIAELNSKVSVIFHSAATVKFIEPLDVAANNNVVSIDNLINLASRLEKLEVLVHVSTAYSNCDRTQVKEVFYDPPIRAEKLIEIKQRSKDKSAVKNCPEILGGQPNSYTYTKAVAESLLLEKSTSLLPKIAIAMVRPSIIAGVWRQPISGWVDNFNGPTGVICALMSGAIQSTIANPNYCADIVPVDIVANLIICSAWKVHQHKKLNKRDANWVEATDYNRNISIFNCVSGTLNPLLWKVMSKYTKQMGEIYPFDKLMRIPGMNLIANDYIFGVSNFITDTFVAYIGDLVLKITGQKPKLVMIHSRMLTMVETLKPFTQNQWSFDCSNVSTLYESLNSTDKEIFNFDVRQIRWDDYVRRYYVGSKIYALKDDPKQVVKARRNLSKIKKVTRIAHTLMLMAISFLVYYFFIKETPERSRVENAPFEFAGNYSMKNLRTSWDDS